MNYIGHHRSKPSNEKIKKKQTTRRFLGRGERTSHCPSTLGSSISQSSISYVVLSLLSPMMSSFLVWVEAIEVGVLDVKPIEPMLMQLPGLCP